MTQSIPERTSPDVSTQRPRLTVASVALGYAAAYLLWARFGGADARMRAVASEGVFLPFNALLAVLFLLASRRDETSVAMRRALRCLSTASALLVAGNVVTLDFVAQQRQLPPGSLADAFFVLAYPFTMVAFLSIPVGQRRMDRWKLLCDAGMVLSFAGLALWYFVLRPIAASTASPGAVGLALLYPLADLVLLVGVATIVLQRPLEDHGGAILWLGVSSALMVAADLVFNLVVLQTGQRSLLGTDVLYLATYLSLVVSAELFWRHPASAGSARQSPRLARVASLLPFMAAGATYALLCTIALRHWVEPLSGAAIGAVAVSVFLGARQLLAFRQNAERVAEAAVRASEARFRSLVQHSSDLIFVLGQDGVIQFASSSASRLLGYEPDALVGVELAALAHPADALIVSSFVGLTARVAGVSAPSEWRLRGASDTVVHVEAVGSNRLADEAVGGIVVNARDVGERKALLDQLAHQAFHDPLTGLANRVLFYDRVSHALDLAHRQGRAVTILFLDLDGFKEINDTLGHAEGDNLLRMIAARLRACARTTDTVARLGGDEFAVLVEDAAAARSADRLVERVREQMAFPFTLAEREVRISASIGSAAAIGGDVDEVLRRADLAMYVAKRTEKGSHRAFEAEMLG
jgi:diguanylate cyclase (GGDEF)-like protein/PAS domain S-box-containing protein